MTTHQENKQYLENELIHQLDRLQTHIAQLPRQTAAYRLSEEERLVLDASTRLRLINTAKLAQTNSDPYTRQNLEKFLASLATLLSQLSPVLTQYYFTHVRVPYQLLTSASLPELDSDLDSDDEENAKQVA